MKIQIKTAVFWYVTPCDLVHGYQRLRGTCCVHLQGRKHWNCSLLVKNSIKYQLARRNTSRIWDGIAADLKPTARKYVLPQQTDRTRMVWERNTRVEETAFHNPERTPWISVLIVRQYVLTSISVTLLISCSIGVGFAVRRIHVIALQQVRNLVSAPTAVRIWSLT
jgi:hypothetical protein